jgi:hypothetical protein
MTPTEQTERPVCGWCNESHPITDCPNRPRLSAASVLAFVAAAMLRGGRVRAWA